jgi:hypothetical protein
MSLEKELDEAFPTPRGLVYTFNGSSNCCKRTQAAKRLADLTVNHISKFLLRKGDERTHNRKQAKLEHLLTVVPEIGYTEDYLKKNYVFFTHYDDDPLIHDYRIQKPLDDITYVETKTETIARYFSKKRDQLAELNLSEDLFLIAERESDNQHLEALNNIVTIPAVFLPTDTLTRVNTIHGAKMMESTYIPIFILVPRKQILTNNTFTTFEVPALKTLQKYYNNPNARGTAHSGICESYATFGTHVSRVGSIKNKQIKDSCIEAFKYFSKTMLERALYFAKETLPFGLLSFVRNMRYVTDANFTMDGVIDDDPDNEFQQVWASAATSCNYMSPAHTDKDGFLSCVTVTHKPKTLNREDQFTYTEEMDVAVDFCMPE